MKTTIILFAIIISAFTAFSQSKTIDNFRDDNEEDIGLFFYASTLQMLDNDETQDFYKMVDGVEKMRFLSYQLGKNGVTRETFSRLKKELKKEDFDELMVVNHEGKRIIVFGRVKKGISRGAVALIEANESINIVDIAGTIDIKNIVKLIDKIDKKTN